MKAKIFSCIFLCPGLASNGRANGENRNTTDSMQDSSKISVVIKLSYLQNSFGFLYEGKVFRLRPNDAFIWNFYAVLLAGYQLYLCTETGPDQ